MKRKKQNRRQRHQAGFTLAETLLAVLIMLMVSTIVATGIPVARNAYEKVVLRANAEVLLSTTIAALRDEIGTASRVEISDGGNSIIYYSADAEAPSKISNGRTSGSGPTGPISLFVNISLAELNNQEGTQRPLVSNAASTNDLYATYDTVSVSADGLVSFNGLKVKVRRVSNDSVLAALENASGTPIPLEIRLIMKEKE